MKLEAFASREKSACSSSRAVLGSREHEITEYLKSTLQAELITPTNAYAVVVDQRGIRNQEEDGVDNLRGNALG